MTIERRPDGALVFFMHVPLWTSLVVLAMCLGFGCVFAYGLFFEDTTSVRYRGIDVGFSLDPWVWKALFLVGTLGMLAPAVIITLGLLRGGKPHVRMDERRLTLGGRPIASDVSVRWDDIASTERYRIQHAAAIKVRARQGKNIHLSAHTFPVKGEFETLCHEIETRVGRLGRVQD